MVKQEYKIGDCLELMKELDDNSIDMILTDLPYGTTQCSWDTVIPFEPLWKQWERITKDDVAIVCTASQPFTTDLINSNRSGFKYCWVWNKKLAGNAILAKVQPLKIHEDIVVFNSKRYYPQKHIGKTRIKGGIKDKHGTFGNAESEQKYSNEYYPASIVEFSGAGMRGTRDHPTQKPVELFEYLIKTYTNEGDTVFDPCLGSGTTLVACMNTGRKGIGYELEEKYEPVIRKRIMADVPRLDSLYWQEDVDRSEKYD